jgi:alanine dehydrogenase
VDGIIHYCVANMPGAVSLTSTMALTNATLPFAVTLANKGWKKSAQESTVMKVELNIVEGKITYLGVAEALVIEYVSVDDVLL